MQPVWNSVFPARTRLGKTALSLLLLSGTNPKFMSGTFPFWAKDEQEDNMGTKEKGWRWSGRRWGKPKKEPAAVVFFLGIFPKE